MGHNRVGAILVDIFVALCAAAFVGGMYYLGMIAHVKYSVNNAVDISAVLDSIVPNKTDTYDLGTTALEWRSAFFSDTVKSETLDATSHLKLREATAPTGAAKSTMVYHDVADDIFKAKVNANTAYAVAISTDSATAGSSPTFNALTVDGDVTLGDAITDLIVITSGAVTQATSITTGVTLSATNGVVTTVSSTLAADTGAAFTVTNTLVETTSRISVGIIDYSGAVTGGAGLPYVYVDNIVDGAFDIVVVNAANTSALAGILKINFIVLN